MKRREFIGRTIGGAGAILVAAPVAALAGKKDGFKPYDKVDTGLFQGVNRVEDAGKKSLLEKKHHPVIGLPEKVGKGETTRVEVTIGEVVHPMSREHFIDYVELFAGNEPAGRVDFRADFSVPRASFYLKLDKPVTLVARAYCNLHGLWESRVEVAPV